MESQWEQDASASFKSFYFGATQKARPPNFEAPSFLLYDNPGIFGTLLKEVAYHQSWEALTLPWGTELVKKPGQQKYKNTTCLSSALGARKVSPKTSFLRGSKHRETESDKRWRKTLITFLFFRFFCSYPVVVVCCWLVCCWPPPGCWPKLYCWPRSDGMYCE